MPSVLIAQHFRNRIQSAEKFCFCKTSLAVNFEEIDGLALPLLIYQLFKTIVNKLFT